MALHLAPVPQAPLEEPELTAIPITVSAEADDERETVAEQLTSSPPRRPNRVVLVGVGALLAVAIASFIVFMFTLSHSMTSDVAAATPATSVVSLPGWSGTVDWETASTGRVATSPAGDRIAIATAATVTILNDSGVTIGTHTFNAAATVISGLVDGDSALVASDGTTAELWVGAAATGTEIPLTSGSKVAPRGSGIVVIEKDGGVAVITKNGLTPFVSPRPGAVALGVTSDGAVQWASARGDGEVLTASQAGTIATTAPLTAPTAGAAIDRWVAGGSSIVVVWKLPDGSYTAATHDVADGHLLEQSPLTAAAATAPWVVSQNQAWGMLGNVRVKLGDGSIVAEAATFQAAVALGDSFYGASETTLTILGADGSTVRVDEPPTITPLSVLKSGDLLATTNGSVVALSPHN